MTIDIERIPKGISTSLLKVLASLTEGRLTATELSATIGTSTANMTGLLDRGESMGLLRRELPPPVGDRRKRFIDLTDKGAELLEEMTGEHKPEGGAHHG
ncbi:MAG TPA: MarR family transcriptional regulator [Bacteroidia bacterium]|nr:MarR family transcriptional regulator [Bacteroidia bacterium]